MSRSPALVALLAVGCRPVNAGTASGTLKLLPNSRAQIKRLRIYNRYLRTSEAVGNYRASLPK